MLDGSLDPLGVGVSQTMVMAGVSIIVALFVHCNVKVLSNRLFLLTDQSIGHLWTVFHMASLEDPLSPQSGWVKF